MAEKHGTAIEWTHGEGYRGETWNPIHGCSKVSPGCAHCYAETLSLRYGFTKQPWTPANAIENVMLKPHKLDEPLRWRKPRMVFVNSMSDLFHELVPDEYIARVFDVMAAAPQHVFQILTKRPERMRDYRLAWHAAHFECRPLPNVWLGTSIENRRFVDRADQLRGTPAAVRFISAEPLLGPLEGLDLTGIDWLIAGGESGLVHRAMRAEWVRDLRDACASNGTAFFFKQWGGRTPKSGGRELDGRTWDERPALALGVVDAATK